VTLLTDRAEMSEDRGQALEAAYRLRDELEEEVG